MEITLSRAFDKEHRFTNGLMIVAVILLVLSLAGKLLIAPPTVSSTAFTKAKFKDEEETKNYLAQAKVQRHENDTVTWAGNGTTVGPSALAFVTKVAAKHNVKLVGFRPQHANDAGQVTQLPFLINLEGAYRDVMAAESDIESPTSKLAVENFQIGSAEESTDAVTGSIAVEAYTIDPVATKKTTKTTVKTTTGTTSTAGATNAKS